MHLDLMKHRLHPNTNLNYQNDVKILFMECARKINLMSFHNTLHEQIKTAIKFNDLSRYFQHSDYSIIHNFY